MVEEATTHPLFWHPPIGMSPECGLTVARKVNNAKLRASTIWSHSLLSGRQRICMGAPRLAARCLGRLGRQRRPLHFADANRNIGRARHSCERLAGVATKD